MRLTLGQRFCGHVGTSHLLCHVGRRHPPPRRRPRRRIRAVRCGQLVVQIVPKLAQSRRGRPALPLLRRHVISALRLPALCVVGVEVHRIRRRVVLARVGRRPDGRHEAARARVAVRHVRLHDEGHVDIQERPPVLPAPRHRNGGRPDVLHRPSGPRAVPRGRHRARDG